MKEKLVGTTSIANILLNVRKQDKDTNQLILAFIAEGISVNKIGEPGPLRSALERKFGPLPSAKTIREKYIDPFYQETMNEIKGKLKDKKVYIILDESRDIGKRNVLNILIGCLDGTKDKPMLAAVHFIDRTDATNVSQALICTIQELEIPLNDILLVVTDQAPYMVLCFNTMKILLPNMHHVTCIVHSLHRVAEKVRDLCPAVDNFLGIMKVVFSRSCDRRDIWKDVTELPLPPEPILTRWGTWINAACFYGKNFTKVQKFIEKLGCDTQKITTLKDLIKETNFKKEMVFVQDYFFLVETILKLEEQLLMKSEQYAIIQDVKTKLKGKPLEKLEESLSKNPDIEAFVNSNEIEFTINTKYAPLTSVDVERSFSKYKAFLASNKLKFKEANIERHLIIQCNME